VTDEVGQVIWKVPQHRNSILHNEYLRGDLSLSDLLRPGPVRKELVRLCPVYHWPNLKLAKRDLDGQLSLNMEE